MAGVADTTTQVRALLGVRRRLVLRSFRGTSNEIVAGLIVLVFLVPVPFFTAWATYMGYTQTPDPWPAEILSWVMSLLWVVWATFPIFMGGMSDAVDLSRIVSYPIHRRALVLSTIAGTAFDFTTWLFVPIGFAIVVAWTAGLNLLFVIAALLVAWSHLVITNQIVVTVMSGVFHTRRFRDLMVVVGALVVLMIWSAQFLLRGDNWRQSLPGLSTLELSHVLRWTPTGAIAHAIERSYAGVWGGVAVWTLYSAVLLAVGVVLWWRLLTRVTANGGALFAGSAKSQARTAGKVAPYRGLFGELVAKEWRLLWRTPQRKMQVFQGAVMMSAFGSYLMWQKADNPLTMLIVPAGLAFVLTLSVQSNIFGAEGRGLATVFLSPIPRVRVLHAKSVVLVCLTAVAIAIVSVVGLVRGGDPLLLAAGWMLAAVVMAPAVVISTMISAAEPYPLVKVKKGLFGGGGGGFAAGIYQMFAMPLGVMIVTAPIWSVMAAGASADRLPMVLGTGLVGVAYATAIYVFGTRMVARRVQSREPEILARISVTE